VYVQPWRFLGVSVGGRVVAGGNANLVRSEEHQRRCSRAQRWSSKGQAVGLGPLAARGCVVVDSAGHDHHGFGGHYSHIDHCLLHDDDVQFVKFLEAKLGKLPMVAVWRCSSCRLPVFCFFFG